MTTWCTHRGGGLQDFVFPSRADGSEYISTRQYARLVGDWVEGYRARTRLCPTVRYLGVDAEDALTRSEATEV